MQDPEHDPFQGDNGEEEDFEILAPILVAKLAVRRLRLPSTASRTEAR